MGQCPGKGYRLDAMKLLAFFRANPCGALLLLQIVALLVYPFLDDLGTGRLVVNLIGIVVVAVAVAAVRSTPALTWVSVLLGGPVLVLTILEIVVHDPWLIVAASTLQAAFYFYTGYALIRYMFFDTDVSLDEVLATGATFTVFAWGFAYAYQALQVIWPMSFSAATNAENPRTWMELLFLSITILTSTGLSDIIPIRPQARAVVAIEQIAGMLYLAVIVARVIALMARRQQLRASGSDDD